MKKGGVRHFLFDPHLDTPRRIKTSVSLGKCMFDEEVQAKSRKKMIPVVANKGSKRELLGSFEESLLHGRIMPVGLVDGFKADIAASGSFCPPHLELPVSSYFFQLDDSSAPWSSPYLGFINLKKASPLNNNKRHRYYIPPKGTIQVSLFNPNGTVLKVGLMVNFHILCVDSLKRCVVCAFFRCLWCSTT